MSTEQEGIKVRIPASLTMRDVVTFVTIAVSVTAAWSMLGTRLTVVEKELLTTSKYIEEMKQNNKEADKRMQQNDIRLRETEQLLEELWRTVRAIQHDKGGNK